MLLAFRKGGGLILRYKTIPFQRAIMLIEMGFI
jgi:hypothetical protein